MSLEMQPLSWLDRTFFHCSLVLYWWRNHQWTESSLDTSLKNIKNNKLIKIIELLSLIITFFYKIIMITKTHSGKILNLYLQVTWEGQNGSKAKQITFSWKDVFHSLVPVSAFHRTRVEGECKAASRSWQASWVLNHSKSNTGLFPSMKSATGFPREMSHTIMRPLASPDARRKS